MTGAARWDNPSPRHRGFTLAELVMSLAVSSVVLAAAAALAYAVCHAWSKSEDINEVVSSGRNGMVRMSDRIRSARAIGYVAPGVLMLWRQDANEDGQVNRNELTLLQVDPATGRLNEGQLLFPAGTSQAVIDSHSTALTAAQFTAAPVVSQLRGDAFFAEGPLAEYVQDVTWIVDAAPPATRLVQAQLTLTKDALTQVLHAGMALRAPKEPE